MPPTDYPPIDLSSATTFFNGGGTWEYFDNCNSSATDAPKLVDWYSLLNAINAERARYQMWLWMQAQGGL